MKIAFIHNEKKILTGANYINDLISIKLRAKGVIVKHFYPSTNLLETGSSLKGLSNILFFYSLLEHRAEILKYDLIQGTTYTPLTFMTDNIPVISHFGSTTRGFLDAVPLSHKLNPAIKDFWYTLKVHGVLKEVNLHTRKPLRDIADIEKFVANRANQVIATSKKVALELGKLGVKKNQMSIIHNAIEDYWFRDLKPQFSRKPALIFLGRIGGDVFSLKLKGVDRLFDWYQRFPKVPKRTIAITSNSSLVEYFQEHLDDHKFIANELKSDIPNILRRYQGSIMFISSRYEGFSLSLIEGMSQGIVPIVYAVGVAPEIIINGVNGFLVKSQQEVMKYTKLLLNDARLRNKMSRSAWQTAQSFTADNMADEFIALYEQVTDKRLKKSSWW